MARPSDEITTQSVQATRRFSLPEVTWEAIEQPGAYVEKGSGDLYRIPKEALIPGASPAIVKESRGASVLVKLKLSLVRFRESQVAVTCVAVR